MINARLDHNYTPFQWGGRYYAWGSGNVLPQVMEDVVNNNGPARIAIAKIDQYVLGKGFKNEEIGKIATSRIGVGESLNSLFGRVSKCASFYEGAFALLIKRDRLARVSQIDYIDLGKLRRLRDDYNSQETIHYAYNQYIGRIGWSQGYDINLPAYKPDLSFEENTDIIAYQKRQYGNYYGEVLFHYTPNVGIDYYPIPSWYSSAELLLGNSNTGKAFNQMAKAQFMPPFVITTPPLDDTKGTNGQISEADRFAQGIRNKLASDDPGNLWHFTASTKDQMPEITTLNATDLPQSLINIWSDSAKGTLQLFDVAPELCGFAIAGQLGNNQQLAIAEGMLNDKAAAIRHNIFEVLGPLLVQVGFENDFDVVERKMYNAIPDQVWAVMTPDEIRAQAGLPPLTQPLPTPA
jgi:hypothetical protein